MGVSVRDLLDSQRTTNITWGENFYQESASLYSGRSYRLTLTYNFGNMKMEAKNKLTKTTMVLVKKTLNFKKYCFILCTIN